MRWSTSRRRLHWHQEEPFLSASIYLQWCVMRLARGRATTVLLDGQGADELLGGYQFYFREYQLDLLDRGQLAALVRETRTFRRRLREASAEYPDGRRRFDPEIALSLRRSCALWRVRRRAPEESHTTRACRRPFAADAAAPELAEALQYNSLPVLLRYADRNAMAFSRETRFPYLDHDLVDWCVDAPRPGVRQDGWQKAILRRAGEGVMPPAIQWRTDKVGYAAPLDVWLRGPLAEVGARPAVRRRRSPRFRATTARASSGCGREHQAGAAENSWALWRWISLNEWYALLEGGELAGRSRV